MLFYHRSAFRAGYQLLSFHHIWLEFSLVSPSLFQAISCGFWIFLACRLPGPHLRQHSILRMFSSFFYKMRYERGTRCLAAHAPFNMSWEAETYRQILILIARNFLKELPIDNGGWNIEKDARLRGSRKFNSLIRCYHHNDGVLSCALLFIYNFMFELYHYL